VVVILYFSPYIPLFTILIPFWIFFFCCHCTHFTYTYTAVDIHTGVRKWLENYSFVCVELPLLMFTLVSVVPVGNYSLCVLNFINSVCIFYIRSLLHDIFVPCKLVQQAWSDFRVFEKWRLPNPRKAVQRLSRLVAGLSLQRFAPGLVHVEFVVDRLVLELDILRFLRFSPVSIIPLVLHTHI
jgi:hypothetical protein